MLKFEEITKEIRIFVNKHKFLRAYIILIILCAVLLAMYCFVQGFGITFFYKGIKLALVFTLIPAVIITAISSYKVKTHKKDILKEWDERD